MTINSIPNSNSTTTNNNGAIVQNNTSVLPQPVSSILSIRQGIGKYGAEAISAAMPSFTWDDRRLYNKQITTPDSLMPLDEIYSLVKQVQKAQDQKDFIWDLNHCEINLQSGRPTLRNKSRKDLDPIFFTSHGFKSFCNSFLTPRSYELWQQVCKTSSATEARSCGGLLLNVLLDDQKNTTKRFRTMTSTLCRMENGDRIAGRMVRYVASHGSRNSYAPYDNLDGVQALLDNKMTREMPVARFALSYSGMRLTLLDGTVTTSRPMKKICFSNSENGTGAIYLEGGLFEFSCTNGLGNWTYCTRNRMNHAGNMQRIKDGVHDRLGAIQVNTNGTAEAYSKALKIYVNWATDVAGNWKDDTLSSLGGLTKKQTARATQAIGDSANRGRPDSLAGLIDGVTRAAQEYDLFEQIRIERQAAKVLRSGLLRWG